MNQNFLKGLLVLLVVVDHNDFSRSVFPEFLYGFSFHVVGFMAIPFLRPAPALDRKFWHYLFRLYFPFFLLVTALAMAVALIGTVDPVRQLGLWAHSLYSGNSELLKQTTHMAMLWYLPSFVALVILRTVIEHLGGIGKLFAIAVLWAIHPLIGPTAHELQGYVPLGLLPALYVVPLAYLIVSGHERLFAHLPRALGLGLAGGLYVLIKTLQMDAGLYNEVGFAKVAGYDAPYALLLNDLEAISGVWMVLQLARLPLGSAVESAGKYSLQVYLFHPFIAAVIYRALLATAPNAGSLPLFCVSFLVTAALTILLSRYIGEHALLRPLLFPRTPHELADTVRVPFANRRETVPAATIDVRDER